MYTLRRSAGQGRPVTRGVIPLTLEVGIGILAAACGASGSKAAATPVQEFYSRSRNTSCEIDYGTTGSGSPMQSVLCLTFSPPRSVVLSTDGSYGSCTGTDCPSNAGVGTPTLDYGDTTGVGPFRCLPVTTGMIWTVNGGTGFRISTAGISPVSA